METYTVKEMAARLHISVRTLSRWEQKGLITPHYTPNHRKYYTASQYQTLVQQLHPTITNVTSVQLVDNYRLPRDYQKHMLTFTPANWEKLTTIAQTHQQSRSQVLNQILSQIQVEARKDDQS